MSPGEFANYAMECGCTIKQTGNDEIQVIIIEGPRGNFKVHQGRVLPKALAYRAATILGINLPDLDDDPDY